MLSAMMIYLIVMIGGAAFLFIMFLMGGFGDVSFEGADAGGDAGGHFDLGGHDTGGHEGGHGGIGGSETVHLSPMSPTLLAFAITTFGAFGLILTFSLPSLAAWLVGVVSMLLAVIAAGIVFYILLNFLGKAQASSIYKSSELVGKLGEVTVKIPKGGTGTVDYEVRGQRNTSSAKADVDIPQGETVRITKVVGNIFYVEKMGNTEPEKEKKQDK